MNYKNKYATKSVKLSEIQKEWFLVDANGAVLGRMASKIAKLIRGKHKSNYTPHMDCGDNVVVINADKVSLTGKKMNNKIHYWHTGYPGGIKETTPERLHDYKPGEVLKLAVKRMLPDGALSKKQLTKLKIYTGTNHPHEAQNPEFVDIKKLNKKNIIKN